MSLLLLFRGGGAPAIVVRPRYDVYGTTIVRETGLVAYWPLDEVSGTTARDILGNFDGTYVNSPSLGQGGIPGAGAAGSALFANASSQYVQVVAGGGSGLDLTGDVTVEAWVKPSVANFAGIISRQNSSGGSSQYGLSLDGSAHWTFAIGNGGANSGLPDLTQFTHMVGVCRGSNVELWLNAACLGTGTQNGRGSGASYVTIGTGADGTNGFFSGNICQAAIYNVALSPAKIFQHYLAGMFAKITTASGKSGGG
jgi:Concanavalin A-like lectin/glucanases superfamily